MRPRPLSLARAALAASALLLASAFAARAADPAPAPADSAAAPARASLVLLWHHQAQFAGYYMALEKGYYRREGLDLEIRRGGPDISPCDELAAARADFCVAMLPTAMEKRGSGIPLVLLAQIVNRSNFSIVAWKHPAGAPPAGIATPIDLAGFRISIWEADLRLPYFAFFGKQGIQPEILPQYYSPSLFLHHGVEACAVMRYNEYHRLMQNGVRPDDITVFNLWEHGVIMPEDGLYAAQRLWEEHPDRCRAFARASLEGWRYAREHPDEALDVVMRYIEKDNLPTNRPHMRWMLTEILRSIFPEAGDPWQFGRLSPAAFDKTTGLLELGRGSGLAPAYNELVTPEARDVAP
jgi:NitT/TauT family transport system substrate-binding protein